MSRNRAYVFTINNPTETDYMDIEALDTQYVVYGKEKGVEGTPHLQGYMYFKNPRTLKSVSKKLKRAHLEVRKGTHEQARDYCKKDGMYVEHGQPPRIGAPKMEERIKRNKRIRELSLNELVDQGIIMFSDVRKIKNAKIDLAQEGGSIETDEVRGEWYYGPSGTGKSYKARKDNPKAYIKAQNKWWDGYQGEEVVILDDLDTRVLGHYLKIWGDKYKCTGEVKGGTVNLKFNKFIITSNWSIEELFEEDPKMIEPIKRRFKQTKFNKL